MHTKRWSIRLTVELDDNIVSGTTDVGVKGRIAPPLES